MSGRRAGAPDTRGAILAAARTLFAERGRSGTSVRAIAASAGVDPALVHHYFGTKDELFVAAADLPVDPDVVRAPFQTVAFENLGETLVRGVLGLWDSPAGEALLARFRTVLASDHGDEIGDFLLSVIAPVLLDRVRRAAPELAPDAAERRVVLALSQVVGAVVGRRVVRLPGLAGPPVDELAPGLGAAVQLHLDGAWEHGQH